MFLQIFIALPSIHKPQENKIEKGKTEDMKMSKKIEYDKEYKVQAVKLAKNIGSAKAAEKLQIPVNTWIQKVKTAELDSGCGEHSPEEALSIAKENQQLKKRIKALEKENLRFSQIDARTMAETYSFYKPNLLPMKN